MGYSGMFRKRKYACNEIVLREAEDNSWMRVVVTGELEIAKRQSQNSKRIIVIF
jgi:hypothetical protein